MPVAKRGLMQLCACLLAVLLLGCVPPSGTDDPLPAWNSGLAKTTLISFIDAATDPGSPAYVEPSGRIAVFDNDGTLWAEEPWPVPFEFVFYRIRQLARTQPEWRSTQPYQAVLESDYEWLRTHNRQAMRELSAVAQAGLTVEQYDAAARQFFAETRHPTTGRPYTQMVYQPMLELITWLRANQFDVYVVSGGDEDFIRAYAEQIYGIPRSHVIGSRVRYKVTESADTVELVRQGDMDTLNIGGFKVTSIHARTGRRPIFAAGNSDGDLKMLRFADATHGLRMLLVHDDAEREFVQQAGYARAQEAAAESEWLMVSMKQDFAQIFTSQSGSPLALERD